MVVAIVQLQIGNIQSQIENVQSQVGSVQSQLVNVQAQVGSVQAKIESVEAQVGNLQAQIGNVQAQIGNAQSQTADLAGYVQNQFNSISTTLENVRSDGREDIRSVDAKIDALSEKVSSFGERMVKVETSLESLLAGWLPAANGGEASALTGTELRSNN